MKKNLIGCLQILLLVTSWWLQEYWDRRLSLSLMALTALLVLFSALADRFGFGKFLLRSKILVACILCVHVGIFAGLYGINFAVLESVALVLISMVFRLSDLPFYELTKSIPGNQILNHLRQNPKFNYLAKMVLLCVFICGVGGVVPYTVMSMAGCESIHDGWIGKPDPPEERHCSYSDMDPIGDGYIPIILMIGLVTALVGSYTAMRLQKKIKSPRKILLLLFTIPTAILASTSVEHNFILACLGLLASFIFPLLAKDLDQATIES